MSKQKLKPPSWYHSRIGKTVYRNPFFENDKGIVAIKIDSELQAEYLYDCSCEMRIVYEESKSELK